MIYYVLSVTFPAKDTMLDAPIFTDDADDKSIEKSMEESDDKKDISVANVDPV